MRVVLGIALLVGLIAFLMHQFPYAISSDEQKSNLIYSVIVLLMLSAGLFSRTEIPWRHHMRYAFAWIAIIAVLMIGYSYKDTIMNSKFISALIPMRPYVNDAGALVLNASEDGHFYMEIMVNHEPVLFMVDTGASSISLSEKDAERVGINTQDLTYNAPYSTANGVSFNAHTNVERMEVAGLVFENMPVSVNKGQLDISLLGMRFLEHFQSYTIQGDTLTLVP